MKPYSDNIEKDPNIFFDPYGFPTLLVYLEFVQKHTMGDPNLLGFYKLNGSAQSQVSIEGSLEDQVFIGNHEINHQFYSHSEAQHRYMESNGAFYDVRNERKLRRQIDSRYN